MNPRSRVTTGRWLLTLALLATIATEIAFTWLGATGQHVFNPEWHPHARFHVVQESILITALSLAGTWLLWRPRWDVRIVAALVIFVQVVYQGAEFVALLVPGTSPAPILSRPNDVEMAGLAIPGNLLFAGLMIVLSVVGGLLVARGHRDRPRTSDRSVREAGARTG